MTFFDPPQQQERHACRPPEAPMVQMNGWRCDCGHAFVREQISQHGETWWQWRRAPEHDEEARR